jgi:naphthoate synthase
LAEGAAMAEAAGEAPRLAYGTDEAQEGRDAFLEKRKQDYSGSPR